MFGTRFVNVDRCGCQRLQQTRLAVHRSPSWKWSVGAKVMTDELIVGKWQVSCTAIWVERSMGWQYWRVKVDTIADGGR